MSGKKIGGEYGEIRASIDVDSLNAYLAKQTPGIKTPVNVKQFKVWPGIFLLLPFSLFFSSGRYADCIWASRPQLI